MKYSFIFYAIVFLGMLSGIFFYNSKNQIAKAPSVQHEAAPAPKEGKENKLRVILPVAYVSETPEGIWKQPWANACEEATVMMVDKYYAGAKSVSIAEAKSYILNLVAKQEERYGEGSSRNSDAMQTADMSRRFADFNAEVKTYPTIDELKAEINAGRPMISMHRGFDLKNPNIEFSPNLSSYHTVVIVGYDDLKKVFITHDPGDPKSGENYEYGYDLFMYSMHDYNAADNKADGPPTVIFTSASK